MSDLGGRGVSDDKESYKMREVTGVAEGCVCQCWMHMAQELA